MHSDDRSVRIMSIRPAGFCPDRCNYTVCIQFDGGNALLDLRKKTAVSPIISRNIPFSSENDVIFRKHSKRQRIFFVLHGCEAKTLGMHRQYRRYLFPCLLAPSLSEKGERVLVFYLHMNSVEVSIAEHGRLCFSEGVALDRLNRESAVHLQAVFAACGPFARVYYLFHDSDELRRAEHLIALLQTVFPQSCRRQKNVQLHIPLKRMRIPKCAVLTRRHLLRKAEGKRRYLYFFRTMPVLIFLLSIFLFIEVKADRELSEETAALPALEKNVILMRERIHGLKELQEAVRINRDISTRNAAQLTGLLSDNGAEIRSVRIEKGRLSAELRTAKPWSLMKQLEKYAGKDKGSIRCISGSDNSQRLYLLQWRFDGNESHYVFSR